MIRQMKNYDEEFKKSSVELFFNSDKSQKQFSRDLGVSDSTFRGWLKKYGELYEPAPANDQERLDKYSKQLTEMQMENELLKKTIAIFSRNLV